MTTSFALLKNTPIWAIHGSGDTQVPLSWDRSMYGSCRRTAAS